MKTSELINSALDWAVAKCEGKEKNWGKSSDIPYDYFTGHKYSTDWSQGGPIIEREGIWLRNLDKPWEATSRFTDPPNERTSVWGPTPLVAAMRCYVASKLGDEVDIPKELK